MDLVSMGTSDSDADLSEAVTFDDEISDISTEDENVDSDGGRMAIDSRASSEEPPTWWEERKARRVSCHLDSILLQY
jgi:hypothetical protein